MEKIIMKATQILMEEHRVIEQVLNTLERAAHFLGEGAAVRPGLFLDAADFIRGFADGCHHKKEEGVLFQSMIAHGVPVEQGPIGVMLADHELGRQYTRQMRLAAERLQAGDAAARQEVVANALAYVQLLRGHILKEDCILFPMADQAIPLSEQEGVADGFEKVEHEETGEGVHEKYLALAQALALEVEGLRIQN
jgi:hemerythrin-like domain-containing protein